MAATTRQRLIETAIRRFYAGGFRNVGLDRILLDVGLSKTAFYKHFESKDQLMLAALEHQNEWLRNSFLELLRRHKGRAAADQLRGLFDVVEEIIESDDFQGCIFINAAMEFPLPHDPAHQAAARNKECIVDIIHDIAERAGAAAPEALAQELCMIMDGAYVGRQVTGNRSTIQIARRLAERVIQAHLGG